MNPPPSSQTTYCVRLMTSADVKRVRELHDMLLPLVTYPSSFFLQLLIMPGRHCLVAVDQARPNFPLGFLSAVVHDGPNGNYTAQREELDYIVDEYLEHNSTRHGDAFPKRKARNARQTRVPRLELLTLGVDPAHQRSGLAGQLVNEMVRRVRAALPRVTERRELTIDTTVGSHTGLPPPSPSSPVTPVSPGASISRSSYFTSSDSTAKRTPGPDDLKYLITYANVSTTNLAALNFYKRIGLDILPNLTLQGLYKGKSHRGVEDRVANSGSSSVVRGTANGNSRDAWVVVGLL